VERKSFRFSPKERERVKNRARIIFNPSVVENKINPVIKLARKLLRVKRKYYVSNEVRLRISANT